MNHVNSSEYARKLDRDDPLNKFRSKFIIPQLNGRDVLYFCGNSLGLQPKTVKDVILHELSDWASFAVDGHFKAKNPWYSYHERFVEPLLRIVGSLPTEVVAMNSLTANLHLLMVSFYRPTKKRFKILCEAKSFPSDRYAMQSQAAFHGFDPDEAVVEITAEAGEYIIKTETILSKIEELGDELALVLFGGVNYYSGQAFDMKAITQEGHKVGASVGFDLAHAAGNLKLNLHDWDVDFAVWCSYKYLNSGPGAVAGAFVHERHSSNPQLPRFTGWWSNKADTRFMMDKELDLAKGAEGWQLSNASVLSMVAHKASLDIFDEAGMDALRKKSEKLTGFLEFIITETSPALDIITPKKPDERGCQLSVIANGRAKELHQKLNEKGIITDHREPDVIRLAPVPLYNSFEDVYRLGVALSQCL